MIGQRGGDILCRCGKIGTNDNMHATGQPIAECERRMRRQVEPAGGSGQWLVTVKSDHRAQLARESAERAVELNPAYEKMLQDVSGPAPVESVDHPAHYGGADDPYEVIKVLEAWGLDEDAYLFNVVKYIGRPGKGDYLTDLKKARWYLDRKIARMERLK